MRSLCGGPTKYPKILLVCHGKPHLDIDRGIQLRVTTSTVRHASFVSPLEDSMTTHTRTRPAYAPAYYLSRPAAFWLAALAPRPMTRKPPRASCASGALLNAEQHTS